jgi:Ca-activated chloride channel family protein
MSSISITSVCNRSAVPILNTPQLVYLLTEISPGVEFSNVRLPINLTLVLDCSGSMAGTKLRNLKEAVKHIIDQLDPADIISIVTFASRPKVLFPSQPAADKKTLKQEVDSIRDGGGTNMAKGLSEGLDQIKTHLGPERTSRLVVLTDGEVTDKEELSQKQADNAGALGVPIIGLGLGKKWNEDFMLDLADRSILAGDSGTGRVDYIQEPDDVITIFQEVFNSMQVVARDVSVNIRMVQGLEARRVWQVTPMISDMGLRCIQGRAIVIPVGDLEQGGASYVCEIMLPPKPAGTFRIAQADVAFTLPNRGQSRNAVDLVVNFTENAQQYNQLNGRVMNIVERVQAYKLQTQALNEAEIGQVGKATQKLRQAVTILLSQGEDELADQMRKEVEQLEKSGEISTEGKKTIKLTSRKTVRLSDD